MDEKNSLGRLRLIGIYLLCPIIASFLWQGTESEWLKLLALVCSGLLVAPFVSPSESQTTRILLFMAGVVSSVLFYVFK